MVTVQVSLRGAFFATKQSPRYALRWTTLGIASQKSLSNRSGVIARSVFCDEAISALRSSVDNVGDCFAKIARTYESVCPGGEFETNTPPPPSSQRLATHSAKAVRQSRSQLMFLVGPIKPRGHSTRRGSRVARCSSKASPTRSSEEARMRPHRGMMIFPARCRNQ